MGRGRVGVLATPILWFYILINFGQDGRESEVRKSQDLDLRESRGYPVLEVSERLKSRSVCPF